jgi:pyruvate dehydrogenase E1 component alpha subunit
MAKQNELPQPSPKDGETAVLPSTRRTFLRALAGAGAAISVGSKAAWADGEIGFWAKDLPDDKLIAMYTTIQRIRWYERTCVDKMPQ